MSKARSYSEERWAAILKNVELMLDYCGFKSPAEVKAARIFLKLGIKNKEEIQKAAEDYRLKNRGGLNEH